MALQFLYLLVPLTSALIKAGMLNKAGKAKPPRSCSVLYIRKLWGQKRLTVLNRRFVKQAMKNTSFLPYLSIIQNVLVALNLKVYEWHLSNELVC